MGWRQVQGATRTFSLIFQAERVKVGDVIAVRTTNYRNSLMKSGGHWQKPVVYHPWRCDSVVFRFCFDLFCFVFLLDIRVLCKYGLKTLNLLMTWTWSGNYSKYFERKGTVKEVGLIQNSINQSQSSVPSYLSPSEVHVIRDKPKWKVCARFRRESVLFCVIGLC